jgi:quaternary ammonium compound-resistance protein SugE
MAWVLLIIAGLFETAFAVNLKLSDGFTNVVPTIVFCICALASFGLLTLALRDLPVGTAYAVWTGLGAAGTAAIGMIFLGEDVSAARIIAIGLILAGVTTLNLSGAHG